VRGRATAAVSAVAVLAAVVSAVALTGAARGERTQHGEVIVSLDGGLSPDKLPRDRLAPLGINLSGDIRTADGSLLPRVTRIEIGLPVEGAVSTRGLPSCPAGRLQNAKPPQALAVCGGALIGHGTLTAKVFLPEQGPFEIHARLLLFNSRVDGVRGVVLEAYSHSPPIVVVLPFTLRHRPGTFGRVLVADLPKDLGPRPRLASFEMTLSRRYRYRGRTRSYLNASCPIPPRLTAGFFTLARANYTLSDGRQIAVEITRGCRGL
jgi:hypothetical protein